MTFEPVQRNRMGDIHVGFQVVGTIDWFFLYRHLRELFECMGCYIASCSLGSHKMKGSAHTTYAVPATALQILLMLARYIPCTPSALDNVV